MGAIRCSRLAPVLLQLPCGAPVAWPAPLVPASEAPPSGEGVRLLACGRGAEGAGVRGEGAAGLAGQRRARDPPTLGGGAVAN
jgi:hypothetical protein